MTSKSSHKVSMYVKLYCATRLQKHLAGKAILVFHNQISFDHKCIILQ